MKDLILSTESNYGYTGVSNLFIDQYVPSANGEFVKVYLYLLRLLSDKQRNVSISLLADTFNQTEADIVRALKYWDKMGVLILEFNGPDNELSNIKFKDIDHINRCDYSVDSSDSFDVSQSTDSHITPVVINSSVSHDNEPDHPVSVIEPIEASKIQFTPEKLNELSDDETFSMLTYVIQSYLGRTLTNKEINSIAYYYDTLHFSGDLIIYLVEYCVGRGKKSFNYIDAVALDWARKGITTESQARDEVATHNNVVYQVMKAFGLSSREPGIQEKEFISKWTDIYCFSQDMIIEACNRTMKAIHQPSFEYTDSILSNWKKQDVHTIQDIKKADADYANTKKPESQAMKQSSNRFNNFNQRDKKPDSWYDSLLSNNS